MCFAASSPLKVIAKQMRKMHVPAYCPVDDGVQDLEYSGVDCEFTKTICMEVIDEDDPTSILSRWCLSTPLGCDWVLDCPFGCGGMFD